MFTNQEDAEKGRSYYDRLAKLEYMDDVHFTVGKAAEGVSSIPFRL